LVDYHLVQPLDLLLIYVLRKMSCTIIVTMEKQKRSSLTWAYIRLFMVLIYIYKLNYFHFCIVFIGNISLLGNINQQYIVFNNYCHLSTLLIKLVLYLPSILFISVNSILSFTCICIYWSHSKIYKKYIIYV